MDENIKCKLFLFVKSCHFIVLFKHVGYIDQPYVLIAFLEIVSHLNQPLVSLRGTFAFPRVIYVFKSGSCLSIFIVDTVI